MVARRKVAFLAALVLWGGGCLAAEAAGREIVLVLFHGCHEGASSKDWKPLQDALPQEMAVIAPELPRIEADGDNTAWMAAWRKEGTAAVDQAFARARSEHPGAFVVAGGAGCGGFFALIGAERHPVDAVVTLSGLSDEAQRSRLTSRRIPVLGMASKDDGNVPQRVQVIVEAGGPGSEMKTFPGKAHGTAILTGQPVSVSDVVRWSRERAEKKAEATR
jgi:hypothetical protein